MGNALLAQCDPDYVDTRGMGLGHFGVLDDEFLLGLIVEHFDPKSLAALSTVSKAWYAFGTFEEIWKGWVLEQWKDQTSGDMRWVNRSWRHTYIKMVSGRLLEPSVPIDIKHLYSDVLFNPHYYAHTPLEHIIDLLESSKSMMRLPFVDRPTVTSFIADYEQPNLPCILRGAIDHWPARQTWSWDHLRTHYADTRFRAEAVDITLGDYCAYLFAQPPDEAPIYLFDKDFSTRAPQLLRDFSVPDVFSSDLFSVLGATRRPDFRWIIVGPERSGSTHHKDPNSTSAWNAVVRGSKLWIMYPPSVTPPGVFPSEDGSEVNTPLSLVDWWVNWLKDTKSVVKGLPRTQWPQWGICKEGEVVFVPNGWWHTVINLEPSVAITQNYVSERNLANVLDFLYHKRNMISGYGDCDDHQQPADHVATAAQQTASANLYEDFTQALRQEYGGKQGDEPCAVIQILDDFEARKKKEPVQHGDGAQQKQSTNMWDNLKSASDNSSSGFSLFAQPSEPAQQQPQKSMSWSWLAQT
ncbi:hypothetical protein RI367_005640 [Sorochytrium milnesiophthora]